jgi:dimethylargininase
VSRGTALIRRPSDRLAEGIVTHVERQPVDLARARRQHDEYRDALAAAGWTVREVAPAQDLPDSVFVEDTVVVFGDLAVLTRPGPAERRPEVNGTAAVVHDLGLRLVGITAPGTVDGGDVLQVGTTVYVGSGGRTNAAGIEQLRHHAESFGRTVVTVPLTGALHLKSAVTALPDGTLLALADRIGSASLPAQRDVEEEAGCHVVPLGDDQVLIAASAPTTAGWLSNLGWSPVVVDISEFEKLEACVTCLSVLISPAAHPELSGLTTR